MKSVMSFIKFQKGNYRRGGLFMLPGVTLGILLAYLFGDTGIAMITIGVVGYTTALILILIGDKRNSSINTQQ